jgi:hypothetical protein
MGFIGIHDSAVRKPPALESMAAAADYGSLFGAVARARQGAELVRFSGKMSDTRQGL